MTVKFTDASHNMLFTMNDAKWRQDLAKSGKAALVGYQEAEGSGQRKTLKAWHAETGREVYHPTGSGNPIGWDPKVFEYAKIGDKPFRGKKAVHPGALAMGLNLKFNPARDFVWVGLVHKETGKRVLRINVHPLAGVTKPQSSKTNTLSAKQNAWKDWGFGQYWLDVLSFAAKEISRSEDRNKTVNPFWDAVNIGGDYNGELDRLERWYYPGPMLGSLFRTDKVVNGLDHLQTAYISDLRPSNRRSVPGNTDHRIHFVDWTWAKVADFPKQ